MAVLTKRLPVLLIPEQSLISFVRDDMIHYYSRRVSPLPKTFCAPRVLRKVDKPCLTPPAVITFLPACWSWSLVLRPAFLAVCFSHKFPALLAGSHWFHRHIYHLILRNKKSTCLGATFFETLLWYYLFHLLKSHILLS